MGRFSQCCFAAALALISFGGIGLGIGMAGSLAVEGIARQPEAAGLISEFMLNYVLIPQLSLAFVLTVISLLMLHNKRKHMHCD
ncbi:MULTISPECIES: ATP F0F1 synthase subunit C [Halobacillus]|uniref:ATP synthase F(0) sector subunit c n=1 Tax=Halobacillus faecis TaxID=360184 RepID=A0A511WPZ5_9BACI|nr:MULTISPECIES: ATP F0F1 synthase subunit C [Halobacillus]MBX0358435.1 F0F1 ATP synthase subunit C [Halobacillus sp. Nhm2S1]GEN52328.1 hypothetical protein HFA01_05900 [Halobacillus faecis]